MNAGNNIDFMEHCQAHNSIKATLFNIGGMEHFNAAVFAHRKTLISVIPEA